MGRRPGRSLAPDVLETILELAGKGATNYVIASAIGIHPDTFQDWLRKGRDQLKEHDLAAEVEAAGANGIEDLELTIHEQLAITLEQVRANLAAEMSNKVIEAAMSNAPNTWQAAMTFLERRFPHEWGKRETRVHEGDAVQALPQINVLVLNDPNARSAHRDLLRSVDAANRSSAGVPVGPRVGGELEAGQHDRSDEFDVDSR